MSGFSAIRVFERGKPGKLSQVSIDELTPGEVTLKVHYTGINYKDALAVTARGAIVKRFPLNAGIDAAGIVIDSQDPRWRKGDEVLVNGCGVGENDDGGLAEVVRVKGDSVVPKPDGLSLRETMILGTAGFTAALALHRMEQNGQKPELGPIAITGASGGVGGFAVQLFSQLKYEVIAISGKPEAKSRLKEWGASQVIPPQELNLGDRPLESVRFGGAVDNVGGKILAGLLASTQLWGNVASIGLASSHELHTTVMPFILRGVSLLGTSSNNCTRALRHSIWVKLGKSWKPQFLEEAVHSTIRLKEVPDACQELLNRKINGRVLVQL